MLLASTMDKNKFHCILEWLFNLHQKKYFIAECFLLVVNHFQSLCGLLASL
uniref:Uncharacterized protein n=1 Tax=Anguilla anguilla TaxID=7936 RepID=A0A0E9RAG6_ANGAN